MKPDASADSSLAGLFFRHACRHGLAVAPVGAGNSNTASVVRAARAKLAGMPSRGHAYDYVLGRLGGGGPLAHVRSLDGVLYGRGAGAAPQSAVDATGVFVVGLVSSLSAGRNPPLATDNLLGNTDGVGAWGTLTPSAFSRDGSRRYLLVMLTRAVLVPSLVQRPPLPRLTGQIQMQQDNSTRGSKGVAPARVHAILVVMQAAPPSRHHGWGLVRLLRMWKCCWTWCTRRTRARAIQLRAWLCCFSLQTAWTSPSLYSAGC